MASSCCKYTQGTQNKEYYPKEWILSTTFPTGNEIKDHKVTQPPKYAGTTLGFIFSDLTTQSPRPKKELCNLYETIEGALTGMPAYKNNSDAQQMLKDLDKLCDKPECDGLTGNEKLKCKCKRKKKWDDTEYENAKEACEGKTPKWSAKKCKCVKEAKKDEKDEKGDVAPIEDDKVRGCMDKKAFNYKAEAEVNYGCVFTKDIQLENKFCFCVTDTCEEIGRCIQGNQVIKDKASSYESFEKKYNRVYENVLKAVSKIKNPFNFRISTEKGFYAETIDDSYVLDLADALTILEFRGFSLTDAADDKLRDSDLVMQNQNGEYLGFFSGASMSSPMYKYFNLQLTDPIVRVRIANNSGGNIVNKAFIPALQRIINKEGRESDKVKSVSIDMDGIINLHENITTVGLGTLLETNVIGLGKLLK